MTQIFDKDIAVAPVEYVTKYSLNRNFLKLVENDKTLSSLASTAAGDSKKYVRSYLPLRVYSKGECAFYKTTEDSQTLYMLCSTTDGNSFAPLTAYDSVSNAVVLNDEHWEIAGLRDGISANPKDYATEYITYSKADFLSSHQDNIALSAHPTRELGIDKSTVAFTSFDNIEEDRKTFFYPNHLETLVPDNSIIAGYMRKWDNGILEYDVQFRVGYGGEKSDTGLDIISANNLTVYHRNDNNLYFRDNADFSIFKQGTGHFAALNGTKQVNLNTDVNAYYAEVKFPQEFKDLNYMVFTSNVKNVDIESYNLKNDVLAGKHDERLIVNGLDIVGHVDDADWSVPLQFPLSVKSVEKDALNYIKEANSIEVKVNILSSCSLMNIADGAFEGSDIRKIVVPMNVRCIGAAAFASCEKLAQVDIFINEDISKQPVLDYGVFTGCTQLNRIVLHYYNDDDVSMHKMSGFGASTPDQSRQQMYTGTVDLYDKLKDTEIRGLYGIAGNVIITAVDRPDYIFMQQHASDMQNKHIMVGNAQDNVDTNVQTSDEVSAQQEEENVNFITIDVKEFLANLNKKLEQRKIDEQPATQRMHMPFSVKNAGIEDDISISCGQLSGQSFAYGKLDNLTITGKDVDCKISASAVSHLTLSGFSVLSSQFISAGYAEDIKILPSDTGMKICNAALAGLSTHALSIDMTGAYLDEYALSGVSADNVVLLNFSKAHVKQFVNRAGIGQKSFAGCIAGNIDVLSDDAQLYDVMELHKMLSGNIQCISDGCSIDNNAMRASAGKVILKPFSKHICIEHVNDAYDYSVVSCNWNAVIVDFGLTQREFTSKNAVKDVIIEVPEGVNSICSNAFSAGLSGMFRESKKRNAVHSPVTYVKVAKTVTHISEDAFDGMPCLKELIFN